MLIEQRKNLNKVSKAGQSLVKKLSYELKLYQKLIEEEEYKLEAIEERDAQKLDKITLIQENLLYERDIAEEQRVLSTKELARLLNITETGKLSEVLQLDIDEQLKSELSALLEEFKEKVLTLNSIIETNRKLLQNNKDFFESLLGKESQEALENLTYQPNEMKGEKDKNTRHSKPVFLDANC